MNKSLKDKLVSDIENRLDDFFDQDNTAPLPHDLTGSLERLKSLVLSIDWEITDACLSDLITETNKMLPQFANTPMEHTLLRMLNSLGTYIKKRKAQAHPDAIKRILSVFSSLESIARQGNTNMGIKKRILAKEIDDFKKLKNKIEAQRAAFPQKKVDEHTSPVYVDQQKLDHAMSAVEKRLVAEVEALKVKMAQLQKELAIIRKSE